MHEKKNQKTHFKGCSIITEPFVPNPFSVDGLSKGSFSIAEFTQRASVPKMPLKAFINVNFIVPNESKEAVVAVENVGKRLKF